MKFCPIVPEICRGQVHGPRKERKKKIIIIRRNGPKTISLPNCKLCLGDLLNVECPVQNTFSNSNSNSAVSVKYLISPNYYIQIKKTTGNI